VGTIKIYVIIEEAFNAEKMMKFNSSPKFMGF
jgi:hypothetical protein